jgi:serine/threonine protein phosphatase PrpC
MLYYSVTAASTKGQRKYMEDRMVIKHIQDDEGNQAGIFVAVLDGHGGPEASEHVRQILWDRISVSNDNLALNHFYHRNQMDF